MNSLSLDLSIPTPLPTTACIQVKAPAAEPQNTPLDRPFNGFRIAASDNALAAVAILTHLLKNYENHRAPRKRKRKPEDLNTFHRQVEALVCDLIHRELTCPGGWLSISLSNAALGSQDRYKPQSISKTIKQALNYMATPEMDHIERRAGVWNPSNKSLSLLTTFRAGHSLKNLIIEYNLSLNDFHMEKTQESIVLKDTKDYHNDSGKWIQYQDTPQTNLYRSDMKAINDALLDADISSLPSEDTGEIFDTTERYLRRYFNNRSFQLGGRVFGGFWQGMTKRDRKSILIDGKASVTLDFGQMNPRVLYGKAGQELALQDAYTVPGLEDYRDGVKMVFNSMLHRTNRMKKKPRGSSDLLPPDMSIGAVAYHIELAHSRIREFFYKGIGVQLFYDESQILIAVLTRLLANGIVALPVHDAIIVAETHEEEARSVMLAVFKEKTGIEGIVNLEP